MVEPRKAAESLVRYLTAHPEEISRFIRSGLGMRLGVPLAAFRWILAEITRDAGLDAVLEVDPPGIKLEAKVERMRTKMRIRAALYVHNIDIDEEQIRIDLRVEGLNVEILGDEKTQLSALIRSGALDLSRPGDLVRELPDLPPVIVHGEGTRIALDLMRSPRFADPRLREAVVLLSSLITVKDVRTEKSEHVDVTFRALPRGARSAGQAVRTAIMGPGVAQARKLAERLLRRSPARYLLRGPR